MMDIKVLKVEKHGERGQGGDGDSFQLETRISRQRMQLPSGGYVTYIKLILIPKNFLPNLIQTIPPGHQFIGPKYYRHFGLCLKQLLNFPFRDIGVINIQKSQVLKAFERCSGRQTCPSKT